MKKVASTIGMGALAVLLATSVGLSGVITTFTVLKTPALMGIDTQESIPISNDGEVGVADVTEANTSAVAQQASVPVKVPTGARTAEAEGPVSTPFVIDCAAVPSAFKVHLDPNGDLWGRLKALEDLGFPRPASQIRVIFAQGGRIAFETATDVGGVFCIRQLPPGQYSLLGLGPESLIAVGVSVCPSDGLQLDLDGAISTPNNFSAVRDIVVRNANPRPGPLPLVDGLNDGPTPLRQFEIRLSSEGQFKALIQRFDPSHSAVLAIPGAEVCLIKKSRTVASVISGSDGAVFMPNMVPGVYTLVVAADGGFSAFDLVLVAAPPPPPAEPAVPPEPQAAVSSRSVSLLRKQEQQKVGGSDGQYLRIPAIDPADMNLMAKLVSEQALFIPSPVRAMGGMSGGGGGGGLAPLGLLGLLGLLGNHGNVASPFTP